jgi:hypothetical protein
MEFVISAIGEFVSWLICEGLLAIARFIDQVLGLGQRNSD